MRQDADRGFCELNSCSAALLAFSQPTKWKYLHTLVVDWGLFENGTVRGVTNFLTSFRPPCLEDVTVNFVVVDGTAVFEAYEGSVYHDICRKLDQVLLEFPRRKLSFLVGCCLPPRRHLWTRELGNLFPKLRDRNNMELECESSELREVLCDGVQS